MKNDFIYPFNFQTPGLLRRFAPRNDAGFVIASEAWRSRDKAPSIAMSMLLFALALSSCVSLLPETPPPSKRVVLSAKIEPEISAVPVDWSLVVEKPVTSEFLDSTRIGVVRIDKHNASLLDYIAGVEWSDRLPHLLQRKVISAFEDSEKIQGVGSADESFRAPYTLQLDIKRFEVVIKQGSQEAIIELSAKMIASPGRKVIAQQLFSRKALASEHSLNAFVKAFDEALGEILTDVVIWSLRTKAG